VFEVKPIGFAYRVDHEKAIIEVLKEYAECLDKVNHFSHLVVIYWMNRVTDELRRVIRIRPKHFKTPRLGVFATRFPARPNPIGVTTVKLIERRGRKLLVDGLDAEDNTPIIDIKPYIPVFDKPRGRVKLPLWVKRHLKEHHHDYHHPHTFEELLKLVELELKPLA